MTGALSDRCDRAAINSSGQTATDIARFWNHSDVERVLLPSTGGGAGGVEAAFSQLSLQAQGFPQTTNYFCGNPLDRMAHMRKNEEWLAETLQKASTKIVALSNLQPCVVTIPDHSLQAQRPQYRLLAAKYNDIQFVLERKPVVIFLGMEEESETGDNGTKEEKSAWFAIDVSTVSEERLKEIHPHCEVAGLYPTLMQLSSMEAAIFGQARTLMYWHDRYQFCPTCGSQTTSEEAGYKRKCTSKECRSQQG